MKETPPHYRIADMIRFGLPKVWLNHPDCLVYKYFKSVYEQQNNCKLSDAENPEDTLIEDMKRHVVPINSACRTTWERTKGGLNYLKIYYEILRSIIETESKSIKKSQNDELVIHYRGGDSLGRVTGPKDEYPGIRLRTREIINVLTKLELIEKYPSVNIVTGFHTKRDDVSLIGGDACYQETLKELDTLVDMINKLGTNNVKLYINRPPEEDFMYLATAKNVLLGHRGFSWLAGCLNYNNVYWDVCTADGWKWGAKAKSQLDHGYRRQLNKGRG